MGSTLFSARSSALAALQPRARRSLGLGIYYLVVLGTASGEALGKVGPEALVVFIVV